jgi:hypothetical protein
MDNLVSPNYRMQLLNSKEKSKLGRMYNTPCLFDQKVRDVKLVF